MKKRILAIVMVLAMAFGLAACGSGAEDDGLIKVGIINNDPNESGYRTANDKSMKEQFTEWQKIFANHVSDKGLTFKIYKSPIQLNSK